MKLLYYFLTLLFLVSCNADKVSPKTSWRGSCSSFFQDDGVYKLSSCCYNITFRDLTLRKGKAFSATGSYIKMSATGQATRGEVAATGSLSKDGETLLVSFDLAGMAKTMEFSTKHDGAVCDCYCP